VTGSAQHSDTVQGDTMSDANSTKTIPTVKPERPEGETTLFWHQSGRWTKKIRGQLKYFGRDSYADALALYSEQAEALAAGRVPRDTDAASLTVFMLCAKFLEAKDAKLRTGDLSQRSLDDYAATCKFVMKAFGKGRLVSDLGPDDFLKLKKRLPKTWGPVRLDNEINRVRILFRFASENGYLDRNIIFGEGFARLGKKTLRKHRKK